MMTIHWSAMLDVVLVAMGGFYAVVFYLFFLLWIHVRYQNANDQWFIPGGILRPTQGFRLKHLLMLLYMVPSLFVVGTAWLLFRAIFEGSYVVKDAAVWIWNVGLGRHKRQKDV